MTTKQIDYCIELAHTLNFSRAAENMFVSQPTLTPAGAQFVGFLTGMREDLKRAIEQGTEFQCPVY